LSKLIPTQPQSTTRQAENHNTPQAHASKYSATSPFPVDSKNAKNAKDILSHTSASAELTLQQGALERFWVSSWHFNNLSNW
jgi:hypothetical protein